MKTTSQGATVMREGGVGRRPEGVARRFAPSPSLRKAITVVIVAPVAVYAATAIILGWQHGLSAYYYANSRLAGSPFLIAKDTQITPYRMKSEWASLAGDYGIQWRGVILIPAASEYSFSTRSDGSSELEIDLQPVVDNTGDHDLQERTGTVRLDKGFHRIAVRWAKRGIDGTLAVNWTQPGQEPAALSDASIFPHQPTEAALEVVRVSRICRRWCGYLLCAYAIAGVICLASNQAARAAILGRLQASGLASVGSRLEEATYLSVLVLLAVLYLLPLLREVGLRLPDYYFGFGQLVHLGNAVMPVWLVSTIGGILVIRARRADVRRLARRAAASVSSSKLLVVAIPVLAVGAFLALRSQVLNPDGAWLARLLPRVVAVNGAHVTHDEMWELYVHSRFWFYTHAYLNWSVAWSYQVLSALAGGLFVLLVILYARLLLPEQALGFCLLMLSGGMMQLFFGDVENYTLTAALIFAYFYASALLARGRVSILVPTALLAVAMTFHLLSGFLLPSLAFLYLPDLKAGRHRRVVTGTVLFVAIVAATLAFLHYHGLPIGRLRESWAAQAFKGPAMWLLPAWDSYRWQQLNLLCLMCPAVVLLVPLIAFRRIRLNGINGHLAVASAMMLFFQCCYRSVLGVYNDWNLFASVRIPVSLLVAYNLLRIPHLRFKPEMLFALFSMSSVHSYSWIVSNHFR